MRQVNLARMHAGLAATVMIVSLLAGAWCFVAAARDRWLGASHIVGLALVELAVLVQAAVAALRLAGGETPAEFATFIGYLIMSVLSLPLAVALALAERTRWGSVIAGVGAVVVTVLTLRLQQLWTPLT